MRGRLLTVCSLLSLLLCAAACALWVRSLTVADIVQWTRPPHRVPSAGGAGAPGTAVRYWHFGSYTDGMLASVDLLEWENSALRPLPARVDRYSGPAEPFRDRDAEVWRVPVLGVQLAAADYPTDGLRRRRWTVVVPHWLAAAALACWPAARLAKWARRRRRAAPGVCTKCGYDLRASPDRCPECGNATPREPDAERRAETADRHAVDHHGQDG